MKHIERICIGVVGVALFLGIVYLFVAIPEIMVGLVLLSFVWVIGFLIESMGVLK